LPGFEKNQREVDFTDVSMVDFKRLDACLGASGHILNPESQILPPHLDLRRDMLPNLPHQKVVEFKIPPDDLIIY
jgi:hypothetical protein